ncbi:MULTISPECIES: alkaline phosphatase family protein [Sphingobium]|uniref:Alkaline phosphatase n=1 Tax=Sphingobium fuliginis (strain ATCC 27551) TaxID=336203 RepID=A0ABQ1ERU6_SPHSA|nr:MULTISPECIES: alkaline phosphatase family protein [Sphingobium]AJR24719.1 alkaline phosphatase [Sphingobium sp. YBL2]RYL99369.1 alkaline phosphatase family protein [Sphingobium fuliginis]WDA36810.1 alkaline phosphatase family protein [Sphingobium sp. YC-XJ3]GFZ84351.1 alkaline phosphatase [Sphingobium fuliginis]
MFKKVAAALLIASSLPALAQPAATPTPSAPPRLIVAIAVDQFSADLFSEYRQYYSGGLKRLTEQGIVFPRGYQSHAATETCPGHSTILTGSRPSRTGIIANSWFDLRTARAVKLVYCAEDETQPGTDSENYQASPTHLRVPTLGGRMKAAHPATRVVSVAGKDRAAIMMGGPTADQVWWLGGPKGYVSYKGVATPPLVARVNEVMAQRLAEGNPGFELPPQCAAKDFPVKAGDRIVGTGRFAREAGDYKAFRISPEQDAMTLAFAAAAIENMALGRQAQTDIISIGLSATDYIGHTYGTEGTESCIQVDRLDRELGAFFDRLDKDGIDYAVVLTADHGGHDLPERHRMNAMPMEQRVDRALTPKALSAAVAERTGIMGKTLIWGDGPAGDLYFDRSLTAAQRDRVEAAALALLRAHPQVQAVFTRAEIAATPSPSGPPESWSLIQEARASFDPQRSGDLLLLLKPRVMSIPEAAVMGSVATHGSPWDTDRRVPILFWRKGLAHFEQPLGVETVDIMPTLAALIELPVPKDQIDGRCLDLIAGDGDSCAAE